MSTETYNPRDRSFIKAPEVKMCPTCGNPIQPEAKPMNNHMNNYLNPITGVMFAINSNENQITIKDVVMYKVTGKNSEGKPVSSFAPVATPAVKAPEAPKK